MRILVTGGAGYVGSACLRYLLREGVEAYAFDNLSQGHRQAVPDGRLIVGDISDTDSVIQAMRSTEANAVMHFAAATCVGESVEDPALHYRNNIGGTLSLLTAMRAAGVNRMLFSSTCATYGLTNTIPMAEDTPQNPCSPYARTKLTVEWMIQDFARAYGIGYTILRYFNAAGASSDGQHGEDHTPETHLIPIALQVALGQRTELLVYGKDYSTRDGTCIRDYIHVDDLARAHRLAIEKTKQGSGAIYNVGSGQGHSVLEVISAVESIVGRPIPYSFRDRRPGDVPALVADARRIATAVNWSCQSSSLMQIVDTAWRWQRNQPTGYALNSRVNAE